MQWHVALWILILITVFFANSLPASDDAAPCSRAEYRQFDFWLGKWGVYDPDDELVGKSRIVGVLGGCAIHESWQSAKSGFAGHSYNTYDATRDLWHQTWVDKSGVLLLLEGGLDDAGRMVLQGRRRLEKGGTKRVLDRLTWTPRADGSVRQLWEASKDGGKSWEVVFDGLYKPRHSRNDN